MAPGARDRCSGACVRGGLRSHQGKGAPYVLCTRTQLLATVLPDYTATTLWLCTGVALGVTVLGCYSALLVTLFDFPGRRILAWALLLPMAMPAYVVAYAYTDFRF